MKWEGNRESDNVEDRRDGGGGGFGGRSIGIGSIAIALIASWLFGVSPMTVLNLLSGAGPGAPQSQQAPAHKPPADDHMAKFVSTVLADTEDVWKDVFSQGGATYREPKLVLFRGATPTGCGQGQSAMGPFYCPGDQKVYIDLAFYRDLRERFHAPGEFAQAYVIAHEVGHHVQNLLGISDKVHAAQQRSGNKAAANALSVRLELQADCFAGVWAHYTAQKGILEKGDVEEALNAAQQIGDDTLQKRMQGYVVPESFNHGTSAQRQKWLATGMKSGKLSDCDTFNNPI